MFSLPRLFECGCSEPFWYSVYPFPACVLLFIFFPFYSVLGYCVLCPCVGPKVRATKITKSTCTWGQGGGKSFDIQHGSHSRVSRRHKGYRKSNEEDRRGGADRWWGLSLDRGHKTLVVSVCRCWYFCLGSPSCTSCITPEEQACNESKSSGVARNTYREKTLRHLLHRPDAFLFICVDMYSVGARRPRRYVRKMRCCSLRRAAEGTCSVKIKGVVVFFYIFRDGSRFKYTKK